MIYAVKQNSLILGLAESEEDAAYLIYNSILDYALIDPNDDEHRSRTYEYHKTLKSLALNKDLNAILNYTRVYSIIELELCKKELLQNQYNDYVNAIDVKQIIK